MTNSVTTPKLTEGRVPHGDLVSTVLAALTKVGLPRSTVDQAHELLIRGLVCGIWGETVHKMGNEQLIAVADAIEELVNRVYRYQSSGPLIDAARESDESLVAEPGHWPWCMPGACVTRQYDDGDTYTEHYGREAAVRILDTNGVDTVRLKACLGFDECTTGECPEVFVDDPEGDCVFLGATALGRAITQLQNFVDDLRLMHTQLTDETGTMTGRAQRVALRGRAAVSEPKPAVAA